MTLPAGHNLEAVIFDFDHTLVELGRWVNWADAVREVFILYRDAGIEIEKIGPRLGFSMIRALDTALSRMDPGRALEVRARAYRVLAEQEVRGVEKAYLMQGALAALDGLSELGLRVAIVSSNATEAVELSLARLRIDDRFAAIVGRTPTLPLKPDPAMFTRCLDLLSVAPPQVMAVGDSPSDIRPAASLGMLATGVTGGEATANDLRAAGASLVIDSLADLPVLLTG